MNARVQEFAQRATRRGGPFDFGPDLSRLLGRVVRTIASGTAVSRERLAQFAEAEGVDLGAAEEFVAGISERDSNGSIVGILPGLTLKPTRHRLTIGGKTLFTWCAADALVVPLVLNRLGEIESRSPLRKEVVRLRISPEGLESIDPKDAVLSMVVVDIDKAHLSSLSTIWGTFCHNIFLFASRDEATEWARGKENIELLSLEDAHEFAKLMAGFVPVDAQATWRFNRPESAHV